MKSQLSALSVSNELSFTPLLHCPSAGIHPAWRSCAETFQNDLFGPRLLDIRCQETPKPKSPKRAASSVPGALSSLPPRRVFVIPRWAKQTCVYQFTVAGRGGLSVRRPALCLSHCETQQQLDFSLTAC